MTRDQLTDEAEDMLFHTRGMSRREQAVALVNTLFWPELAEARAKALEEAAVFVETHSYTFTSGSKNVYAMKPTHEKWRGADMQQKTVAAAIRALKDRAP